MIHSLITNNTFYHSISEKEDKLKWIEDDKTHFYDCKFEQTSYGSVIVTRPKFKYKNEFYPSSIQQVNHLKE